MKVTVLGCHAPYAPAGGACSGYLVESEGIKIVLDCGNGTLANLQKHTDFREITALIVTHFHPDHYADIYCWRHALKGCLRDGSRNNPLLVYMPKEPKEIFSEIDAWRDEFAVIPIDDALEQYNFIGSIHLSFYKTNHPLLTYGVALRKENKKFVYSSDTGWDSNLIPFVENANLLLCECSLRSADVEYTKLGHLTSKEAGTLASKGKVQQLALTHFWPEFNKFQLMREAENVFAGKVILAKEGLELIL